jgi:hypothetical protein
MSTRAEGKGNIESFDYSQDRYSIKNVEYRRDRRLAIGLYLLDSEYGCVV